MAINVNIDVLYMTEGDRRIVAYVTFEGDPPENLRPQYLLRRDPEGEVLSSGPLVMLDRTDGTLSGVIEMNRSIEPGSYTLAVTMCKPPIPPDRSMDWVSAKFIRIKKDKPIQ